MNKRLNIVLPEATLKSIDRLTKPGERRRFIDKAVQHYISNQSIEAVRARLERPAVRDRDMNREVAGEWSAADREEWQAIDKTTRAGVKSTSRRSRRRKARRFRSPAPCW